MRNVITQSTASLALGIPPGHRLLEVAEGQYRGRLVAIVHKAADQIALSWADSPYSSWSESLLITGESADTAFDAAMEPAGDIHVVYVEKDSFRLSSVKLDFDNGAWVPGIPVTIYDAQPSYYPSLAAAADGALWVAWTRSFGDTYYLQVKASGDGGAVWGSGPSDSGEQLSDGGDAIYARLTTAAEAVHLVYSHGSSSLSHRQRPNTGGGWTPATSIGTGEETPGVNFDVALAASGLLGVIFSENGLYYREFDGYSWGPPVTIDSDAVFSPQLYFEKNIPTAVYLKPSGTNQAAICFANRPGVAFSQPEALEPGVRQFDSVLLYHAASAAYADLTIAAAGETASDVFHPNSGVLCKDSGDTIYLGMADRFRFVRFMMATAGGGGSVTYSYWDGSNWRSFTPDGGAFPLDAGNRGLRLWPDLSEIPDDWQREAVNDIPLYWLKIQVVTTFSTGPVADQITAIPDLTTVILRR